MNEYDAVVFGIANPDIVVYPPEGIKLTYSRLTLSDKRVIRPGGPGGIVAIALARLGLKTCFIGNIGYDIFGRFMEEELKQFGVDTSHAMVYSGEEIFTISIVDEKGEGGTMIAAPPTKPFFHSSSDMMSHFKKIPKGRIFYLGHWFWPYLNLFEIEDVTKLEILRSIKERGFSIVLDINYKVKEDPSRDDVNELINALKHVDILLPNERDAKIIVKSGSIEKIARTLLKFGPKIIGLKLGDKGCYVASIEASAYVPAFKVKVEDTAGAGEVFGAAFTYGWLKGWDIKKIGEFANAASAYYISHAKPKEKFPTSKQVLKFLEKRKHSL